MKPLELIVLVPCHSLEDFPLYGEGEAADSLLAAWCAPWHPRLLIAAGGMPVWYRIDDPPLDATNRLYFVPAGHEWRLPHDFLSRAEASGAIVLSGCSNREELVNRALAAADCGESPLDAECVHDFLALGHARLQVELLTRQMRYTSRVDDAAFRQETLAAAAAAARGELDTARTHLASCHELLYEARKFFYPVDAYLIDLTLVSLQTLGAALRNQLAGAGPHNVLINGQTLQAMADREPATLAELKNAIADGRAAIVGGDYSDRDPSLDPPETHLSNWREGLAAYERLLRSRPKIYGRRCFGLSPETPQLAARTDFAGALHFTLDDGQFPTDSQCKVRWEGDGATAIDCLARLPRDAARPESLLDFSRKMGESMDHDHVATVVFAHWPGRVCTWYEDLQRIAGMGPSLGTFVSLDQYFATTTAPGRLVHFAADGYRSPRLTRGVAAGESNPIGSMIDQQRRAAATQAQQSLAFMVVAAGGRSSAKTDVTQDALAALAAAMTRPAAAGEPAKQPLAWVANPFSFARRIGIALPQQNGAPAVDGAVVAAGMQEGQALAVVDIPPMGTLPIAAAARALSEREKRKLPKVDVGQWKLENQYLSLAVNGQSGGILAVRDFRTRGNRLTQQLALRTPGPTPAPGDVWTDPDSRAQYTQMVAESLEIIAPGPVYGAIQSRGALVDQGSRKIANFRQTVGLWAGSRVAELEIEIEPQCAPDANPWRSYYCSRLAWPKESVSLYRSANWRRRETDLTRIESAEYVECQGALWRTALLTDGLPYHRRSGANQLDTLLVVRGEEARTWTMGIGIDLAYPLHDALSRMTEPFVLPGNVLPAGQLSPAWLFHLGARNLIATHWECLCAIGEPGSGGALPPHGFRLRVLETEGRAAAAAISAFRPIAAAVQTDFLGQRITALPIEDGKIMLDLAAHEWLQVEATF